MTNKLRAILEASENMYPYSGVLTLEGAEVFITELAKLGYTIVRKEKTNE